MISGDTPKHLVVAARTGFLTAVKARDYPWQRVANTLNMDARAIDLVDLGAAPMPKNSRAGVTIQDFVEKTMAVSPLDWDITVWISQNAIDDDQTGLLERRVRGAGQNFQKGINARVFQVLNAGDTNTYGLCYDGQPFFSASHVDKGAQYQTPQSNMMNVPLSPDNFNAAWVAAQAIREDQGEFTEYMYDLLVSNPVNMAMDANITGNPKKAGGADNDVNPFDGKVDYLTTPYFDTTAAHLVASNEEIKPIIVAMREQPYLQSTWFDATKPDGGRHYFKFFARYEMHYGDWRTAYQINS